MPEQPIAPRSESAASESSPPPAAASQPVEAQLPLEVAEHPADRGPDPLQQARDAMAAGEWTSAATALRALLVREPRNARARAALAELLEKKGDSQGALGELDRA